MKYYIKAISQYVKFTGRSTRAEFWYFILFEYSILFFFTIIAAIFDIPSLPVIFFVLTAFPFMGIMWRRMHDTGNPGWYVIIPVYGFILLCTLGTEGGNRYGNITK